MRSRLFPLLIACIAAAGLYCGSDNSSAGPDSTDNEPPALALAMDEYVHFNLSNYVLYKRGDGGQRRTLERYLWWERNCGEPFTDVDSNGTYDRGIDIFIMSVDATINQDKNHNGKWDGPDEWGYEWTPGIPFDDIDGNGECRFGRFWDPTRVTYEPGTPFLDANGNGVWDSTSAYYDTSVMRWILHDQAGVFRTYRLVKYDTILTYTSDSGYAYSIHPPSGYCDLMLEYRPAIGLALTSFDPELLIVPNTITARDTLRHAMPFYYRGSDGTIQRQIGLDRSIEIDGVKYDSLLWVRFDQIEMEEGSLYTYMFSGRHWEFYFSRNTGLLAYKTKSGIPYPESQSYFEHSPNGWPLPFVK